MRCSFKNRCYNQVLGPFYVESSRLEAAGAPGEPGKGSPGCATSVAGRGDGGHQQMEGRTVLVTWPDPSHQPRWHLWHSVPSGFRRAHLCIAECYYICIMWCYSNVNVIYVFILCNILLY